jgi:amino acid transporter
MQIMWLNFIKGLVIVIACLFYVYLTVSNFQWIYSHNLQWLFLITLLCSIVGAFIGCHIFANSFVVKENKN